MFKKFEKYDWFVVAMVMPNLLFAKNFMSKVSGKHVFSSGTFKSILQFDFQKFCQNPGYLP